MSPKPHRVVTVSEFIRESKPDWDHVAVRDRRASTGSFTGAPVVSMGALAIPSRNGRFAGATMDPEYMQGFQEQLDEFDEQNLSGVTENVQGETDRWVDDLDQETVVVGKVRRVVK